MSKTHEILISIKNMLRVNDDLLGEISAEDIVSCVFVELYGLKQIYGKGQLKEIENYLVSLSGKISNGIKRRDPSAVLEAVDELITIHNAFPDSDIALDFIEGANYDKAYIRHKKDKTIVALGDSHVNYFSGNEDLSFVQMGGFIDTCAQVNNLPITCLHLGPCLAYNSDRYGSSTTFREKLDYLIDDFLNEGATIISCLGEIDLRAHVFKQTERQNATYEEVVDGILKHYESYLTFMVEQGFKMACWGPIATQKESTMPTQETPRFGTEKERNRATEYFNRKLEEWCSLNGIKFFSVFRDMITNDYETKAEYLSGDEFHLGQYSADYIKNTVVKELLEW